MWIISNALMKDYENSRSLQVRAAESLAENCSDGEQSAPLNMNPMPQVYLSHDRTTEAYRRFQSLMTLETLTEDRGEDLLTWYREDFLAPTYQLQEKVKESQERTQDFGKKWPVCFGRYDQDSRLLKTAQLCLIEDSMSYLSTLPNQGSMRSGQLFQQVPLAHVINATGFGFLPYGETFPTPTCTEGIVRSEASIMKDLYERRPGRRQWSTLTDAVTLPSRDSFYKKKLWQTPTAIQVPLRDNDTVSKFPTPVASMHKGSSENALNRKDGRDRTNDRLDHFVGDTAAARLNPEFVEWLMGWPINWTSLEPIISEGMRKYYAEKIEPHQRVRGLQKGNGEANLQGQNRRYWVFQEKEILQPEVLCDSEKRERITADLFSSEGEPDLRCFVKESETHKQENSLPGMQNNRTTTDAPHRRKSKEQQPRKLNDIVYILSHEMALEAWESKVEETIGLYSLWESCKGAGLLSKTFGTLQEIWQSLDYEEMEWLLLCAIRGNGFQSEYPTTPRVTSNCPNRAARLKAIGNGQVPLCAATAFKQLKERLNDEN